MIRVCGLDRLEQAVAEARPSHVVTLLGPDMADLVSSAMPPGRHFRLAINDVDAPSDGVVVPDDAHVARLIEFLGGWTAEAPIVIHCWMGVSRSTAAAYTLLCMLNPGREAEAARHLRARAPHAQPNRAIVAHADALLGRNGAMRRAVAAMGAGDMSSSGGIARLSQTLRDGSSSDETS